MTPVERIYAKCHEDGDCLIWHGATHITSGAPWMRNVKPRYVMWEHLNERPVPKGRMPTFTCGRKECLVHLKLSTRSEIMVEALKRPDAIARKQVAARTRALSTAKLTYEAAERMRASGKTQRDLAIEFGVAQSLVSRVINGHSWRVSVPNPFAGLGARS